MSGKGEKVDKIAANAVCQRMVQDGRYAFKIIEGGEIRSKALREINGMDDDTYQQLMDITASSMSSFLASVEKILHLQ